MDKVKRAVITTGVAVGAAGALALGLKGFHEFEEKRKEAAIEYSVAGQTPNDLIEHYSRTSPVASKIIKDASNTVAMRIGLTEPQEKTLNAIWLEKLDLFREHTTKFDGHIHSNPLDSELGMALGINPYWRDKGLTKDDEAKIKSMIKGAEDLSKSANGILPEGRRAIAQAAYENIPFNVAQKRPEDVIRGYQRTSPKMTEAIKEVTGLASINLGLNSRQQSTWTAIALMEADLYDNFLEPKVDGVIRVDIQDSKEIGRIIGLGGDWRAFISKSDAGVIKAKIDEVERHTKALDKEEHKRSSQTGRQMEKHDGAVQLARHKSHEANIDMRAPKSYTHRRG